MTLASFIDRSKCEKEDWRYTDLDALLAAFSKIRVSESLGHKDTAVLPQSDMQQRTRLVFMNGVWQPSLSSFGSAPSCILMGDLESGYKLTVGEQTCLISQPIEMIFVADDKAPQKIEMKFSFDIGDNGRLTLLENHLASSVITTIETDIMLNASAKFVHGKIVSGGAHLSAQHVHVHEGGYYSNVSLLRGCMPGRNEIDVVLEGKGAQAALNGIMLLDGRDHADTVTRITHQAANCTSRQVYKTVLNGKAHGVFQGKITVAPDAQKSDGYQLSRALLLSDQAEMDVKPELEIYADDVKCSHGSTIGELDEEALFYLRSRGLNEAQARALLIEAFIAETIDDIQIEEWRDLFRSEAQRWTA